MERAHAQMLLNSLYAGLVKPWCRHNAPLLLIGLNCGVSPMLFWEAGFDVTVADPSEERIRAAKSESGSRVEYYCSKPDSLPFEDGKFVCSVTAFTEDNSVEALQEAMRVASEGLAAAARSPLYKSMCWSAPGNLAFLSPRFSRELLGKEAQNVRKYAVCPLPFTPLLKCGFNTKAIPFPLGIFWGLRAEFHPVSASPTGILRSALKKMAPVSPQTGTD